MQRLLVVDSELFDSKSLLAGPRLYQRLLLGLRDRLEVLEVLLVDLRGLTQGLLKARFLLR